MRSLAIVLLACLATEGPAAAADTEANKALIRSYYEEMWNKHQPSAADRFVAINFIEHNPHLPQGLAGRKQFVTTVLAGFSDYHGEIQEILAEGDKVVTRIKIAEHWEVVDLLARAVGLGLVPPPTPSAPIPPSRSP
jgi:SnoaL-like polyketide cyclase